MTRPVRPIALVILTICMVYPGLTMLWQGLYIFGAGAEFTLMGHQGPWVDLAMKAGIPLIVVYLAKAALGLALLAAAGSVLYPVGPMIMGIIALVCLLGFRENAEQVPA
jgi:hypothetical protein